MSADHDQIQESLAAFLVGASDSDEAEMVRAHLDGCSSCQELARRLQASIDAMPLAVDAASPPARLRERILKDAAAARQSVPKRPQRTRVLRLPRPAPRPGWGRGIRVRTAVAAAALIAFALGAGIGLGLGRSLTPPQAATTVAQYSLTGSGPMAGAQGRVYELKSQGLTLIQLSGLPRPEQGHVYELWLIPASGPPAPAGVFVPDSGGSQVVVIPRTLVGFKQIAVTQEVGPDGVSAPTQQPQLAGTVS